MEKKELPVEVVNDIFKILLNHSHANRTKAANEISQYVVDAYATKLVEAEEKIKVLDYDNKRLRGEVEVLTSAGEEASGSIEFLDVQNSRLRKMLSDICEKAGESKSVDLAVGTRAGAACIEIEGMITEFFKEINKEVDESAGESDAVEFAKWITERYAPTFNEGIISTWLEYTDKGKAEYATHELYTIFKQQQVNNG